MGLCRTFGAVKNCLGVSGSVVKSLLGGVLKLGVVPMLQGVRIRP